MLSHSLIRTTAFHSVLGEQSILAPSSESHRRNVVAELLLTALIDAFSILVIFLLMNFSSTGEIIFMGKGMELPKAVKSEPLEPNPVVKIDNGQLYLGEKLIAPEALTAALLELKTKYLAAHPGQESSLAITIQGDRRLKYQTLNSIVLASSEAGYSDIKFAVIMK